MKKIVVGVFLGWGLIAVWGADVRRPAASATLQPVKKKCMGYTVIEYGVGVDCNGDTVRLTKTKGHPVATIN